MEVFYEIIALLGGLAMFLYGMRVMGDGSKNSSGGAMQTLMKYDEYGTYFRQVFGSCGSGAGKCGK